VFVYTRGFCQDLRWFANLLDLVEVLKQSLKIVCHSSFWKNVPQHPKQTEEREVMGVDAGQQ